MVSTIVCDSGREYVQGDVLVRRKNAKFNIFKAKYILNSRALLTAKLYL